MKFLSWSFTLVITLLALAFAFHNSESVTVVLWPFGLEVATPLYLLTLGVLFTGLIVGGITGWLSHLPHRFEAHRLRRDNTGLRNRLEDMRAAPSVQPPPAERLAWRGRNDNAGKINWRFWKNLR